MQPFHWLLAHNHVIPKYKRSVYFLQNCFLLIFSSMIVSVISEIESDESLTINDFRESESLVLNLNIFRDFECELLCRRRN